MAYKRGLDVLGAPEPGQGGFRNWEWRREGPGGGGGHNYPRPHGAKFLDQSQRDYHTTWKREAHLTPQDILTNNAAKAYKTANFQKSDNSAWWEKAWEVLDWDAYNRDPQYQGWFQETGKKSFGGVSDIWEAERWASGAQERREQHKLAELQAKYEQERAQREEAERVRESLQPKYLDIGGQQIPVGGVNDYIQGLHQQWDQTTATQLDAISQRWRADQTQQAQAHAQAQAQAQQAHAQAQAQQAQAHAQAQEAWNQKFNERELDWSKRFGEQDLAHIQGLHDLRYRQQNELSDLRSSFADKSAAQDRLYDTRISDLTSQWGDQRSQYDTRISDLTSQWRADQAQYDTRISDLTSQWGSQQAQFEKNIGGLQGTIGGLEGTIGGLEGQIGGLQTQVSNYQSAEAQRREAQMQDAHRARVASAYAGSPGWNAPGGVHSAKALLPQTYPSMRGATAQFGRSGMRISSLNI